MEHFQPTGKMSEICRSPGNNFWDMPSGLHGGRNLQALASGLFWRALTWIPKSTVKIPKDPYEVGPGCSGPGLFGDRSTVIEVSHIAKTRRYHPFWDVLIWRGHRKVSRRSVSSIVPSCGVIESRVKVPT